jgi:predicted nucleic acid-binding protein
MKLELAVCDTGPLLYLTLIEELEILTKLFARILLPATVREELIHPKAPTVVRQVFGAPPPWLRIQSVDSGHTSGIQLAEAHAIHLAKISSADMLLIDDAAG